MSKSIQYYEDIFNNIDEPILLMEGDIFVDANISALNFFNILSKDEFLLLHPSQLSPKYQLDGELSSTKSNRMIEICLKQNKHKFEWLSKTIDGETILIEINLKKIHINNKELIHCVIKDLENIKKLEKDLVKCKVLVEQKENYINQINQNLSINNDDSENLLESLLLLEEYKKALDESSIVSKSNLNGNITYVNEKFCEVSGYTKEELIGNNHNIIRSPDTPREYFVDIWKTITNKKVFKGVIKNKKKNGQSYFVDSTIIPILDKNNEIVEYIAIRNDITSVFEKDKMIHEQFTDELTLLPNRQNFLDDLKNCINPKLALISIDRFRDINNSYGIEVGDKILKTFAKILMMFKSTNLNVYRISGDIFAFVAFGNFKITELYKTCNNLNSMCDKDSFIIDDDSFDISFTIGIADTHKKLLTHAEVALFWAKEINVDIAIFDKNLPIYKDLKKNIELTKEIKLALKNDNILMYAQKIINNKTKEVKYETLMRMKDSKGKIVSPFIFLEHAKRARLYPQMTSKIVEKSCEYFKDKDIMFSINLMIEDIKNEKTINHLFNKLKETNTAHKIILEIVESEGIENSMKL